MPEIVNTSVLSVDAETDSIEDNRPTMIKVDHVSMVFNKASEQLNSLKEYAIKLAKRQLFFEGFKALDDVSFEVKKGDVFGIMGTNGSGKSTMLKIIAGVLEPTSGTCEINGKIAPLIELGAGFDMDLTARENVYLNGALLGYSKDFIDEHFDEIVDFAEIESFLDMPLKNYSSGMVARIAFAIATVIVPEILVVDEVLSVGDFMFQKKCEDRINELIEKHGVTVLIVSHSNDQIARLCNKAIWIEKGHTRLMGDAVKVARMYGGLGGRVGSAESEKYVFDVLKNPEDGETVRKSFMVVAGENASSTNAKLIMHGWAGKKPSAIAMACDSTHANAIVANALAAAYDAPILTFKADYLPDATERLLYEFSPRRIFAFDCGGYASEVVDGLSQLPWAPDVVYFDNDALFDLSVEVFNFGLERGLWHDEAAIINFQDNPESLVASSYLYANKVPVFLMHADESHADGVVLHASRAGIGRIIVFGDHSSCEARKIKEISAGIDVKMIGHRQGASACVDISRFIATGQRPCEDSEICLASYSLAQWPELLSCGCFCAKKHSVLLLVDMTNLDNIAECLRFVRENAVNRERILFIGSQSGLGAIEQELFSTELIRGRTSL